MKTEFKQKRKRFLTIMMSMIMLFGMLAPSMQAFAKDTRKDTQTMYQIKFVSTSSDMKITVKDDNNREIKPSKNDKNTYAVNTGTYTYSASAEGYESITDKSFKVVKSQEIKVKLFKKDSSNKYGTAKLKRNRRLPLGTKKGPLNPDNDLTGKVTINSVTSPNAEIKNSANESDFSSSVPHNSNVDYTIDLTVDKGTPILTDDYVEIPVTADSGKLFITHGLTMIDAEDGSILGDAEILEDKIIVKFTRISNAKTAAKIRILTTLRGVLGESKGFDTQAERDAYKSAHPTKVDKVKILDKNVNVNVQSNLWVNQKNEFFAWNSIAGDVEITSKNVRPEKGGATSSDNTIALWSFGVDRIECMAKYRLPPKKTANNIL